MAAIYENDTGIEIYDSNNPANVLSRNELIFELSRLRKAYSYQSKQLTEANKKISEQERILSEMEYLYNEVLAERKRKAEFVPKVITGIRLEDIE